MKKFVLSPVLAAAALGLAACGGGETGATNSADAVGEGFESDANASGAAATAGEGSFPEGARIVEENGVTYRVDADGTRTALGPNDARIVEENGVRYRVDPGGARIRIDEQGVALPDVDVDLPDVDVGVNEKGNPDVDVSDDPDADVSTNDNR